jgi:type IV pilus biogenesis protein CpaD/CtpE
MRTSRIVGRLALAGALALLAGCASRVQRPPVAAGAFPDAVPAAWGVRLGDSAARVDSVLGPATSSRRLMADAVLRRYADRDLELVTTGDQGVAMVFCYGPRAVVAGARVGMGEPALLALWGAPYRRYDDGRLGYKAATWGAAVRFGAGREVAEIQLGLTDPNAR